jgi:hypothetical protein
MDRNLRAYQIHRLLAWIYGLGIVAYALYAHFRPNWLTPELKLAGTLLPLLFLIHVLGASGSARLHPWARILSLVMGVLLLFAFPIGTVFGVLLLAAAWKPWVEARPPASPTGGWHQDATIDRRRVGERRSGDRRGGMR